MKRLVLIFFAVVTAGSAAAQGISQVRQELSRPDYMSGARVEVSEQSDAAAAIRSADHPTTRTSVTIYGVSLFRDNSQTAGENARAVAAQFAEHFPEIAATVSYESPYFRVEAGSFVDRTDAVALWGRALAHFPKAVVVQAEMPLEQLVARNRAPGAETQTSSDAETDTETADTASETTP